MPLSSSQICYQMHLKLFTKFCSFTSAVSERNRGNLYTAFKCDHKVLSDGKHSEDVSRNFMALWEMNPQMWYSTSPEMFFNEQMSENIF